MLHRHILFIFSSTMKWLVYVISLRSHYTSIMWYPYRLFYDNFPPWPSDGYIMTVIILLGSVLYYALILFMSTLQILLFRVKKLFCSFMNQIKTLPLNIKTSRHGDASCLLQPTIMKRSIWTNVSIRIPSLASRTIPQMHTFGL